MKSQNIALVGLGLVILGVATYFAMKTDTNPALEKAAKVAQKSKGEIQNELKKMGVMDPELRKMIPWVEASLGNGSEGAYLEVNMQVRKGCNAGDLDAVKAGLKNAKANTNVLVSIESLNPFEKNFEPVQKVIPRNRLFSGFKVRLNLPEGTEARQLGLFICKDSADTKRCNDKEALDVMDAYREGVVAKAEAPDRIYFFQYLFQEEGKYRVFQNAPAAETFTHLSGALGQWFPNDKEGNQQRAVDRAKELSRTLGSVALIPADGKILMTLPMEDKVACAKTPGYLKGPTAQR